MQEHSPQAELMGATPKRQSRLDTYLKNTWKCVYSLWSVDIRREGLIRVWT